MKTIAITNLKGGTGKTATATNMAYILSQHYHERVLLIDADAQRNASFTLVDETQLDSRGLSDYLTHPKPRRWREFIIPSRYRDIDVLPGDSGLWSPTLATSVSAFVLQDLRDVLIEEDAYDTVIIDCPPGFQIAAINAVVASSVVVIPATLDGYSFSGAGELVRQIDMLRTQAPNVRVGGILLTRRYKSGIALDREGNLRHDGRFYVYKTVISNSLRVNDSAYEHCPVAHLAPHSWATIDYKHFVKEFLDREEGRHE